MISRAFGREPPDAEIKIEKNGGNLRTVEQVFHVIIGHGQLIDAALQFCVDRGGFLVQGLKFLLGGLQFLIGALQLLIGGLQLFVGGFKFFDGGLQVFPGVPQLLFERRGS